LAPRVANWPPKFDGILFYQPWPQGLQIGFPNSLVSSFSLGVTTRPMRPKPKLSMRRGAWAWVHVVWTCGAKVFEY